MQKSTYSSDGDVLKAAGAEPVQTSRVALARALRALRPTRQKLVEGAGIPFSHSEASRRVAEPQCFRGGTFGFERPLTWERDNLLRGINYLLGVRACMAMVEEHEQQHGVTYDVVTLTRPDMAWYRAVGPWCTFDLPETTHMHLTQIIQGAFRSHSADGPGGGCLMRMATACGVCAEGVLWGAEKHDEC